MWCFYKDKFTFNVTQDFQQVFLMPSSSKIYSKRKRRCVQIAQVRQMFNHLDEQDWLAHLQQVYKTLIYQLMYWFHLLKWQRKFYYTLMNVVWSFFWFLQNSRTYRLGSVQSNSRKAIILQAQVPHADNWI